MKNTGRRSQKGVGGYIEILRDLQTRDRDVNKMAEIELYYREVIMTCHQSQQK